MPFQPTLSLKLLIFIYTAFPFALAKRGGGGKGGGDLGDSTSGLSLAPLPAAAFAFCVIFAIFNAFQTLQAIGNIYRRSSQRPPSIALPEFSVGSIFPISLLFSALMLTIFEILNAILTALTNNQNVPPLDRPEFSQSYLNALTVIGYLIEILLIVAIFALLAHREQVLVTTPPVIRGIKMVFDAVLTAILFSLGMAVAGLLGEQLSVFGTRTTDSLYTAYIALFLVVGIDILVSSVVLHFRARSSPLNDHKITFLIALVVSPSFILHAVYAIVIWNISITTSLAARRVNLATIIIVPALRFIIIATCLGFGMPPISKQKRGVQEP